MILAYALLFAAAACSLPMAVAVKGEGKKVKIFTRPFLIWLLIAIALFSLFAIRAKQT